MEEVLSSMVAQYHPPAAVVDAPDADEMARQVLLAAYGEAREYWRRRGDTQRAAMTDEQLDAAFWLFDADGIPRLKTDKAEVVLPESSLYQAGQVLRSAGFRSGQTDISTRRREILKNEYADDLLSRIHQPADDASAAST